MNEIFSYYISLPLIIKGLVVPTSEGDYNIFINTKYPLDIQAETYQHEVRHILMGHYEQLERSVTEVEKEASTSSLLKNEIKKVSHCGISSTLFPLIPEKTEPSLQNKKVELTNSLRYKANGQEFTTFEKLKAMLAQLDEIQKKIEKL